MEKPSVFMIMPFQEQFFEVYQMIKQEFDENFIFSNAGEEGNQQNILQDIIRPIYEADVVIADLTDLNANVLYELGIAHTFNKKTIVITQNSLNELPFDLKQYRAKDYGTHFKKFADLIQYLKINLSGAIDGNVIYSNPVKDFIDINKIQNINWFNNEKINIDIESSEKGFLDFLADIEHDTERLTESICDMTEDMTLMSEGIEKSTKEIERVNQAGGNSVATFIRKEAKKTASYIETFSKKLKTYNVTYTELWNKIEKNIHGLLENKYAITEQNKDGLVVYVKSLKGLQNSILQSNGQVVSMKEASLNNMGIERTLNQSIRFLDEDLKTYLIIMEQMITSIDKIFKKSRFVVGEIDFSEDDCA